MSFCTRCDLEQGLYADAKRQLDTGMSFAIQTNEPYVLSKFYNGYAKLSAINNQNRLGHLYFKKAIEAARKNGDIRNEYEAYLAQAKYLKHISNHEKSCRS